MFEFISIVCWSMRRPLPCLSSSSIVGGDEFACVRWCQKAQTVRTKEKTEERKGKLRMKRPSSELEQSFIWRNYISFLKQCKIYIGKWNENISVQLKPLSAGIGKASGQEIPLLFRCESPIKSRKKEGVVSIALLKDPGFSEQNYIAFVDRWWSLSFKLVWRWTHSAHFPSVINGVDLVNFLILLYWAITCQRMPDQISVSEFLSETTEDYNSPTTSSFTTRLQSCRNTVNVLEEVRPLRPFHHGF